jgi:general stress protein 26
MAKTSDHEIVSIYPFTDEQVNDMMTHSMECVLMWATKDSWPVGVTHAFVWEGDKIWITFAEHRHRTAAIKRNPKVSVNNEGASADLPGGAITFKGTGEFHNDEETKLWFYKLLAQKLNPGNPDGEAYWVDFLDSPLRTVLSVTPVKKIMYNSKLAGAHMAGTVNEEELGERLSADAERMNKAREDKGLDPR